jgi:hypothetical protein
MKYPALSNERDKLTFDNLVVETISFAIPELEKVYAFVRKEVKDNDESKR